MNYETPAVFEEYPDQVISNAKRDDMIWVLLSFLQTSSREENYDGKATELLIRLYDQLQCPINCRYLRTKTTSTTKYTTTITEYDKSCGLLLKRELDTTYRLFVAPSLGSLWKERDVLIQEIQTHQTDLTMWFHLVRQYTELEELLMAVWTLFLIKLNAPATPIISEWLSEHTNCIRAYAGSGGLWEFVSETTYAQNVEHILKTNSTREHLAGLMSHMLSETMTIPITGDTLLGSFCGGEGTGH